MYVTRSRRFSVNWPIQITHAEYGVSNGAVVNISTSGVLFRTLVRYPVGQLLHIDIDIPGQPTLKLCGPIIREARSLGNGYYFAVQFKTFFGNGQKQLGDCLLELRRAELADEWGGSKAPAGAKA